MEEWKFIYESKIYQISNTGKVRSIGRATKIIRNGVKYDAWHQGKEIASRCTKVNPHYFVYINHPDKNGDDKRKIFYIHRLVADHFIEKPPRIVDREEAGGTVYASHIEKDYTNNHYTNIRWITHRDLINSQPKRLADPTKAWRTRREKYGKSGSPAKELEIK